MTEAVKEHKVLTLQVGLEYYSAEGPKKAEIVVRDCGDGRNRIAAEEVIAREVDNLVDAPRLAVLDRKTVASIARQIAEKVMSIGANKVTLIPVTDAHLDVDLTQDAKGEKTTSEHVVLNLSQSILLQLNRALCDELKKK